MSDCWEGIETRTREQYYAYAQERLRGETDRLQRLEFKVQRLLTVVAILAGLSTLSINTFAEYYRNADDMVELLFVRYGGLYAVCLLGSILSMLFSIQFLGTMTFTIGEEISEYFKKRTYDDILVEMANRYLEGARHNRDMYGRKVRWAQIGYALLVAAVVIMSMTVVFYVCILVSEVP